MIRARVLYVAEDRKQSSLDGFWETLMAEQISGIEAVAMDMWDLYIESVRVHVPEADGKIVFHKFHFAKASGRCLDKVRRKEHKTLSRREHAMAGSGTQPPWSRTTATSSPN